MTRVTPVLALVTAALGAAILVRTALLGGGVGFLLGAVFLAAGLLRLYVSRR